MPVKKFDKKALAAEARNLFYIHERAKELFGCEDGHFYFRESSAQEHNQKRVKNGQVHTFARKDMEPEAKAAKNKK